MVSAESVLSSTTSTRNGRKLPSPPTLGSDSASALICSRGRVNVKVLP